MSIYFLVARDTLQVLSAGPLPETWGTITGLKGVTDEAAADLSWANYPNHGFFKRDAALALGVPEHELDAALRLGAEALYPDTLDEINRRLSLCDWVVVKASETGLPMPQVWADYRQALRDVQRQPDFPFDIDWPTEPVGDPWSVAQQTTLQQAVEIAAQKRLDDFARTRGYRDIASACSYANSTDPQFNLEGNYCVTARDTTWRTLYTLVAAVEQGQRPMPTFEEAMSELPELVWPEAADD